MVRFQDALCSWHRVIHNNKNKIPHYIRARNLVTALRYDGDILWTELVKCQSLDKTIPPIETLRVCINRFLDKEIGLFKSDTIFSLGNVAYNYCALRFVNHLVVGVPHPNARGQFYNNNRIASKTDYYVKLIEDKRDVDGNCKAVFLH